VVFLGRPLAAFTNQNSAFSAFLGKHTIFMEDNRKLFDIFPWETHGYTHPYIFIRIPFQRV